MIAQSYERIHRSNLIGMGILPLEFLPGESLATHGLSGTERIDVRGIEGGVTPGQSVTVYGHTEAGREVSFPVRCRVDTPVEAEYYRHGGILQYVLRGLLAS